MTTEKRSAQRVFKGAMRTESLVLEVPTDATSEWLSRILGSRVDIVANEPIADAGIVSSVARLRLDASAGPSSVIVKCAPLDKEWRERVNRLGLLKTEAFFYRDIGAASGMPIPHCYYSDFREVDGRCTIVMEDLDPLVPADNERGLTFDQAQIGIRLLAGMHGRHWQNVDQWPWLADRVRAQAAILGATNDAVPAVVERYADRLPTSIVSVLPDLADRILDPRAPDRTAANTTLVHGDFHAANIAFGHGPDEVKVFDWQLAMASSPGVDLVKLIANGMTAESRREFGPQLIESYLEGLAKAGVTIVKSELDQLVRDALFTRIAASVRVAFGAIPDSYTERWAMLCMDRMGAALEDGW
jgi:hypothetical protein